MTWNCVRCGSDKFRGYKRLCAICYQLKWLENPDNRKRRKQSSKVWKQKNKERHNKIQRDWRKNNKSRANFILAKSILKRLSSEQRKELFDIYKEE